MRSRSTICRQIVKLRAPVGPSAGSHWVPTASPSEIILIGGRFQIGSTERCHPSAANLFPTVSLERFARHRPTMSYPYILVRHLPTVVTRHAVPGGVDSAGALCHARRVARDSGHRVCLVLGEANRLYLTPDGEVEAWSH